ncbi:DUF3991 domain-containing protein [Paludicola sp. MB14-C6]|uniref:DUF7768 domain-containing protein n=1 Tax=Paludihabitans sp. MB14-C6 TaxID=3070656 RepID=UPI0027DDBBC2|nr:DUF3991 domain-containing protein [Paludicola sp. MB14-C6]WMJ24291.1 DUF3991 domain-containing protein [Paludicola sp. MB14-C6]
MDSNYMKEQLKQKYPLLNQNKGYFILDETKDIAVAFSPTAPDKMVIWDRDYDGNGYNTGRYGSSIELEKWEELKQDGIDVDKVQGILSDIGYTDFVYEKPFYMKLQYWNISGIAVTEYYNSPERFNKAVERCDKDGIPYEVTEVDKDEFDYETMAAFQGIKVDGHVGTWSAIDKTKSAGEMFYLMEHDTYGDETASVIINTKGELCCDNIWNGFNDETFIDYIENTFLSKEKETVTPPSSNQTNRQNTLRSIVTQTYESDPNTHLITNTHTRTANEVFDELKQHINNYKLSNIIDYSSLSWNLEETNLPSDCSFLCKTDFGGSEGIYIDIKMEFERDNQFVTQQFATIKTLEASPNAFMNMSMLAAECQLLLNGNGRVYEFTQEQNNESQQQPVIDPNRKTVYVCSPLAGEIEANIRKAREFSKYVAKQGATPIAPHITELFNDQIPEEREMGLALGIDYLRKSDELWVFGDRVSQGMANEIKIAQDELHIPIFHVNEMTFEKVPYDEWTSIKLEFYHNQNKAISDLPNLFQLGVSGEGRKFERKDDMTKPKAPTDKKENFTRDQLDRAKQVDLFNYVSNRYQIKPHGGKAYKLIEGDHDSVVIFPNTNSWFDFANAVGGDTVSFLVQHEGKGYVDAVKELINETFNPQKLVQRSKENKQNKERVMLPEKAENNKMVWAYLLKTRGLDRDIVYDCIKNGSIYQSNEVIKKGSDEFTFNNCVFVGFDKENNPRYASKRSIHDIYGCKPVKQDYENSEKQYGFVLEGYESADWLTVCESPIEAISFATLRKINGEDYKKEHILSIGGMSFTPIDEFLLNHPNINTINIALNNDSQAVNQFGEPDNHGVKRGQKLIDKYSQLGYQVLESYPKAKDYNLELKLTLQRNNQPIIKVPEQALNNKRSYMHLTETKQLDKNIVKEWLDKGNIYQADHEKKDENGNIKTVSNTVFVQRDKNGIPIYAISVNYNQSKDRADFRIEYKNEEQARCYLSQEVDSNDLLVFNNPISMLTHMTYLKESGKENKNNYLCCMSNYTKAVQHFISSHPKIKNVKVMLDQSKSLNPQTNQLVDYRDFTFKKIKKTIANKSISVTTKYPKGIDLNKDLAAMKEAKSKNKSQENGIEKER